MAYPTVSAPYGFKPVNLIGGRVYSGSTRMVPIAEAYNTNLFNGDLVKYAAGTLVKSGIAYNTAATTTDPGNVGIFVGAEFSSPNGPIYGKNRYQYYPANTVAQDIIGYVVDDPQACFRVACLAQSSAGLSNALTAIGYISQAYVGSNVSAAAVGTGTTASGDSLAGVTSPTAPNNGSGIVRTATTLPFRIVQLVPDTAITLSGSGTSSTNTITLASAVTGLQAGMQVIVSNVAGTGYTTGGYPGDYNYVTNVNGTAVTIANSITAAATVNMTFVGYPEAIVSWNFGYHSYTNAVGV